jgi:hypothetical protein
MMDALGVKLGPLLFHLGYFNKEAFIEVDDFFASSYDTSSPRPINTVTEELKDYFKWRVIRASSTGRCNIV